MTPPAPKSTEPVLRINSAGNTCVGWSSVVGGLTFSHPSEKPHAIWHADRAFKAEQELEHLFFEECSFLHPVQEKLREPLSETHDIVAIVTFPQGLGLPMRRPLSLTAGLVRRSMLWVGPPQGQVQANSDKVSRITLELTGDGFYVEPADVMHEHL